MDWKKLLKGLTSARDVINSVGSPGRKMSAGEKFIQTTKNLSEKYDIGYNIGQRYRALKREEANQPILPAKKKQTQSQPNYGMGNIDLNNRPIVNNPDGSKSTVLSFSIQDERDGKETLIPQVVNGKVVSEDEAIKHYYETGEHLGKFNSIDEANNYAEKLHLAEEARIGETPQNYQVNANMWNRVEQQAALNLAEAQKAKQALQSDSPLMEDKRSEKERALADYDLRKEVKEDKEKKELDEAEGLDKVPVFLKQARENLLQKPRNLADGYDFGDISTSVMSSVLGTGAHYIGGLTTAAINTSTDAAGYSGAFLADMFGNKELSNKLVQATKGADRDIENAAESVYKIFDSNAIQGKTVNKAAEAAGQSTIYLALGVAGEGASLAGNVKQAKALKRIADLYTFTSGAAGGMKEAYADEEATPIEVLSKGIGGGATSYFTENMFDWMGYGGNNITNALEEKLVGEFNSGFGKAMAKLGFSATGEATEEIVEELLNKKAVNTITNMIINENKYDTNVNVSDLVENATIAYLSVWLSGAPSHITSAIETNLTNKMIDNSSLSDNQKNTIKEMTKNFSVSPEQINDFIKNAENNNQNIDEKWKDVKVSGKAGETGRLTKKQLPTIENKPLLESNQQTIQEEAKMPENTSSQEIGETKEKQLEIIKNSNPMSDDNHVGIRNVEDIKTFEEAIEDDESFVYGDYSKEDAKRDLEKGTVTVYSSKPIEQGGFVSTSQNMAKDYAGNGEIYSKEVPINDVAWINGDEGQYAKVDTNNESTQDEGSFIVPENAATNENIEKIEDEDLKEIKKNSLLSAEDNTKARSFPISAQESDTLSEEVKKENSQRILKTESGRYTPIANQTTIDEANETIQNRGADNRLAAFNEKFENNEKIELKDLAEAELLIQHYSDLGDSKTAVDLIEKVGILGTELGQMVQALSIIKKMTPEGQLRVANRLAERLSQKYDTDIKLSDEVKNEIKNSKMENLDEAMDKAYTELAEQIPLTFKEQLDNFRFLAMLGNPKTHIRNIVGNVGNRALTGTKNKVKGLIEEAVGMTWKDYQKDATIRFANKDQRTFAKMDAEILGEDIDNVSNKYKDSPNSEIERRKRNFNKTNIPVLKWVVEGANWAADKNAMLLNKEDAMALKAAYRDAMQNYMAANNLSSEDLTILDSDSKSVADQKERALKNAREYAARQAQEATFHQANQIATWLNNLSRQDQLPSRILGLMVDATVPFKKTPLNIVRQGVAYSPFNLIRSAGGFAIDMNTSMKKLKTQLDSGKITKQQFSEKASKMVNERIDQFSKGLTGSGIALLGVFLNQLGLLKAGDNDDEDEYETALGKQEYSLNIGDYSISLEWLSPSAMPMLMGAEISDLFKNDEDMTDWGTLLSGSTRLLEPAFDTTMLSSLTSALKSYGEDTKGAIGDMATNAAVSYLMQYYPSLFTNIAKTIDPVYRDTTSTKKGFEKKVESAKNRLISQVPFASRTLESKKDAYGEDVQRAKTLPGRIAENFLNPATVKKITNDSTTRELERLSEKTDVTGLLKTSSDLSKDYTIDGVKHRYDSAEYSKAKGQYGKTIKSTLDALIKSDSYKNLSDPEKAEMVKDIYSYSREAAKVDYAKKHSLPYSSKNDMYNSLTAIKQAGGKDADYFKFKVDTNDMTSKAERMTYLNKMSLPDKVKKAIYENDVATYQAVSSGTDEHYNALKSITGDKVSSDYLDYVEKNSNKYFVGDKDAKGKAIKGREKKDKVREFVNNSNMSNIEKYYVYTKEGYAKSLSQKQRSELRAALESNKNYMDEETYNSMIKKLDKAEQ